MTIIDSHYDSNYVRLTEDIYFLMCRRTNKYRRKVINRNRCFDLGKQSTLCINGLVLGCSWSRAKEQQYLYLNQLTEKILLVFSIENWDKGFTHIYKIPADFLRKGRETWISQTNSEYRTTTRSIICMIPAPCTQEGEHVLAWKILSGSIHLVAVEYPSMGLKESIMQHFLFGWLGKIAYTLLQLAMEKQRNVRVKIPEPTQNARNESRV